MAAFDVNLETGMLTLDASQLPYPATARMINDEADLLITGYGVYTMVDGYIYVDGASLSQPARTLSARATLHLKNGTTMMLESADIARIKIDWDAAQNVPLGATPAAAYTIEINNMDRRWDKGGKYGQIDLDGILVEVEIGAMTGGGSPEMQPLGQFICEKAENQEYRTVLVLAGSDFMGNKLMKPFADTLTYPVTCQAIYEATCQQAGVSKQVGGIPNGAFAIQQKPVFDEGMKPTCRDIIGWVAQITGCNAYIDRQGRCVMKALGAGQSHPIDTARYKKLTVNGIVWGPLYQVEIGEYGAAHDAPPKVVGEMPDGLEPLLHRLIIRDNPLIPVGSNSTAIGQQIISAASGLVFDGGALQWPGKNGVAPFDALQITNLRGQEMLLAVSRQRIEFGPTVGLAFESGNDLESAVLREATGGI